MIWIWNHIWIKSQWQRATSMDFWTFVIFTKWKMSGITKWLRSLLFFFKCACKKSLFPCCLEDVRNIKFHVVSHIWIVCSILLIPNNHQIVQVFKSLFCRIMSTNYNLSYLHNTYWQFRIVPNTLQFWPTPNINNIFGTAEWHLVLNSSVCVSLNGTTQHVTRDLLQNHLS